MKRLDSIDLRYEFQPCHRSRSERSLNFYIEKSDEYDACLPSLPVKPIPISAYIIIPMSLPPSPIERTFHRECSWTFLVMNCFCVGEHQHTITDLTSNRIYMNKWLKDNDISNTSPVTIKIKLFLLYWRSFWFNSTMSQGHYT